MPKHRSAGDLSGQRGIARFGALIGLIFTVWFWLQHRKSARADGEIITGAGGEKVEFDSIIDTDRRKWETKGIPYAIYEKDGKKRRLCLNDHKFIGAEEILIEAERRIKARTETTEESDPDSTEQA